MIGLAFREHAGDRESHRDAVIAKTGKPRAVQRSAAMDFQAVVQLDNLRAHRAQIVRDRGDAIGFLDSQFLRVADDGGALGERAGDRQDRQFIDQLRNFLSLDHGRLEMARR